MGTLSDSNVSDETILDFVRQYAIQRRACDEQNSALRAILKRAKAAGCNTKQIVAVHLLKQQEPDVVVREVADLVRYLRLRGVVLEAADLFTAPAPSGSEKAAAVQAEIDAEDGGYRAGLNGHEADANPHHPGTPEHVAWEQGRREGAASAARLLPPGERVASGRKERPARPAADRAPAAEREAEAVVNPIRPPRKSRRP